MLPAQLGLPPGCPGDDTCRRNRDCEGEVDGTVFRSNGLRMQACEAAPPVCLLLTFQHGKVFPPDFPARASYARGYRGAAATGTLNLPLRLVATGIANPGAVGKRVNLSRRHNVTQLRQKVPREVVVSFFFILLLQ